MDEEPMISLDEARSILGHEAPDALRRLVMADGTYQEETEEWLILGGIEDAEATYITKTTAAKLWADQNTDALNEAFEYAAIEAYKLSPQYVVSTKSYDGFVETMKRICVDGRRKGWFDKE